MASRIEQAHLTSPAGLAATHQPDEPTAPEHSDPLDNIVNQGGDLARIELAHGVPVVSLTGELDLLTCPSLQHLLGSEAVSAACTVVVDTSGVTFIDCAGLNPLLRTAVDLRRRRGFLLMLRPSAAVLRLAALTGTCELLDLTVASAAT